MQLDVKTTKCAAFNHPEFRVTVNAATPLNDMEVLVSYLEQSVQGGVIYANSDLIEIGSNIVRLVFRNGYFDFEEPDFLSVPIEWVLGVTNSLKQMRLQKDIAGSYGLENALQFPTIRQSLVAGCDLTEQDDAFVLERTAQSGMDSGWFVGRLKSQLDYNDVQNLMRISLYEAIVKCPRIAGFLALPSGTNIELTADQTVVSHNGIRLSICKHSLLDDRLLS